MGYQHFLVHFIVDWNKQINRGHSGKLAIWNALWKWTHVKLRRSQHSWWQFGGIQMSIFFQFQILAFMAILQRKYGNAKDCDNIETQFLAMAAFIRSPCYCNTFHTSSLVNVILPKKILLFQSKKSKFSKQKQARHHTFPSIKSHFPK